MRIEGNSPSNILHIDQNKNVNLLICQNGNISVGTSFQDLLGAKLALEGGTNCYTAEQGQVPGYLDLGKNVNVKA